MASASFTRRAFVKGTASAIALASLPKLSIGATPTVIRLEWQAFKTTPHYASFLNAVRTMKNTSNSSQPNSWQYWVNVHLNYCPHSVANFLTWHRGYIYYFEQQLRTVSGDSRLVLPYWDYYTYPVIPSEFTDPASGNPLYVSRVNTNVYQALDLSPFGSGVTNFQRGLSNAFEPALENAPHNPVHDIIGSYMGDISTAPVDPIFYLHHCNLDRLWNAWSRRSTSKVPAAGTSYWNGSFTYAGGLTMAKSRTRTTTGLGYDYANDTTPTALPPQAQEGRIMRVQAQTMAIQARPPLATLTMTPPRSVSSTRESLGGVRGVSLGASSVSAVIPLQAASTTTLQDVLVSSPAVGLSESSTAAPASSQAVTPTAKSFPYVKLVLDGVKIAQAAKAGGFFYNVYLNLPATGDVDAVKGQYFVGTLGAFQISTAAHHGKNMIDYDVTDLLAQQGVTKLPQIVVSFVRINAAVSPRGDAVAIQEIRLELGTDAP
ncbi:tyrosinase family protein [Paraburkholderia sediminicola]|uniref:Tyrosinase family protein n=1 Tax=Paraburkholderia rhynchosiae TaxID=487049 RepID=A0ACC7NAX2_9BURK